MQKKKVSQITDFLFHSYIMAGTNMIILIDYKTNYLRDIFKLNVLQSLLHVILSISNIIFNTNVFISVT